MHQINDAIVRAGKLDLSNLPFAKGQHVRVIVAETDELVAPSRSIQEIRKLLRGGVERFDDPFDPMIPGEDWEMFK